jgi:hypothetical protein
MLTAPPADRRELKTDQLDADLVVVGGGLAGTCCAITAARAGVCVVLIQDRPVLGGNASSEVRLWVLGATSHMGNNNRWAREGGVIDEILVENVFRNPEGNPVLVDPLLLEKVVAEPNITLLLNTAVHEVEKTGDRICCVRGFCSQNSTRYELRAPLFCDASGDGVVGFLAGAAFRMGAEAKEEFGEGFAPANGYGELLGHSLYFYTRDAGRPVRFTPPAFALRDITRIPRWRQFNTKEHGCQLWWIEYGGRLDTVHDTERIKWELWQVVYGVWDHIKNSGQFPEAETLTLEWVGVIPGKRESRRFEGDYILTQRDIVGQRPHPDAVSYGGWAIDLHPADGVFSEKLGCSQWHSKGVYPIPYRCLYSRNVPNLFLAGRTISTSHVAFGSTRVMATCAHTAQAVGMAAAVCTDLGALPRDLVAGGHVDRLQRDLLRVGQHIPGVALDDPDDLARQATVTATSSLRLGRLKADGPWRPLADSWAMMLPVAGGPAPAVTVQLDVDRPAELRADLRVSGRPDCHTPDVTLAARTVPLAAGAEQAVRLAFDASIDGPRYAFYCLHANEHVRVRCSEQRVTGVLAVAQRFNPAVAKSPRQEPPPGSGIDAFEFWTPQRRPGGQNLAVLIDPPLAAFGPAAVTNGIARPTRGPNAWVADPSDPAPALTLTWDRPRTIDRVELTFDTDFDHPMETVLLGHPERVMPFCVRGCRLRAADGRLLAAVADNHQTRRTCPINPPATTDRLIVEFDPPDGVPVAVFGVRCYGSATA